MQITGHKIIKEPVQITVDNKAIWDLVAKTCFPEYGWDYVDGDTYYASIGECKHSGDNMYKERPATEKEAVVFLAIKLLEKVFYENSAGK